MLTLALALFGTSQVAAFPGILEKRDFAQPGCTVSSACNAYLKITPAQAHIPSQPNAATKISAGRTNCGILGECTVFDASKQYVSTTGEHAFIAPGKTDIRGPCPGLNAAANHGYLPRNGIATLQTTVQGLYEAYGFAPDFSAFLDVFSAAIGGDATALTWSIGGPMPTNILSPALNGDPQGISYTHNKYEGDTSISRCDAYTNGGDAHSSSMTRFGYAYAIGMAEDDYNLDNFAQLYAANTHRSIQQNAYYFAPFLSTTVVSPAAYNFVINFMSNHSAAKPGGYLNGAMFKQFFAVTGEYPNFTWKKGYESIPDNWYRRPDENLYGAAGLVADLIPDFVAYPDTFRFGGNVNGKNSYVGIDIANATNGVYNINTLFQGDNFACFLMQNIQQITPTQLQGGVNNVGTAIAAIEKYMPAYFKNLKCPTLSNYDASIFAPYTGSKYSPSGPKSGPQNC